MTSGAADSHETAGRQPQTPFTMQSAELLNSAASDSQSLPSYPFLIGRAALMTFMLVLLFVLSFAIVPRLLGYQLVTVTGGSMADAAPVGSLVIVSEQPGSEVEIGNVIMFKEQGAALPKLHRVIGLDREDGQIVARTQGDANRTPDPKGFVLTERVWTPVTVFPYLGYLVSFAAAPLGWTLVIAIPAAILCFSVIRWIWSSAGPNTLSQT